MSCYFCRDGTDVQDIPVCVTCRKVKIEPCEEKLSSLVPSKSIEDFSRAEREVDEKPERKGKKSIRKYYRSVRDWIEMMKELQETDDDVGLCVEHNETNFCVRCATYCSFGLNLMLLFGKALALSTSSSYTIIAFFVVEFDDEPIGAT